MDPTNAPPPDDQAAAGPSDLDQFHRYETGAKIARAHGDTEASNYLRQQAAQYLSKHYAQADAESGITDPTSGMSSGDKLWAGTEQGVADVGRHLGNLVGLESDDDLKDSEKLDAPLMNTTEGKVGSVIGQTAATAPLMALPMGAAARAGTAALKAGQAANLAGRVALNPLTRAAVEGGAQGALMTDPGQSRLAGAAVGAGLGAAPGLAGSALGKVATGLSRTPAAQLLIDKGVYPTIGQLKPGGIMSTVEQTPGIRQLLNLTGGKQAVQRDYTKALAQEVAAPGTTIQGGTGQDMLNQSYESFQPLYDQGKGILRNAQGQPISTGFPVSAQIMGPTTSTPLSKAFAQSVARTPGATPETKAAVQDWLQKNLQMRINDARRSGQGLTASDLLQLRSDIRDQSRAYGAATDSLSKGYRSAYDNANDTITQALKSQLPPDAMDALNTADAHYGDYKQLEDAFRKADAGGRGDTGPTPYQLSSSIASANKGQPGAMARGQSKTGLKQLADAGVQTFQEQPEMRTGHSMVLGGGLLATMAALTHPLVALPLAAGAALGYGSRTARKLAAGATGLQKGLVSSANSAAGMISPQVLQNLREIAREYSQRALVSGGQGALEGPTVPQLSYAQ